MSALLSTIQKNLESIYEVSIPQNIRDFLITDKNLAEILKNELIDEKSLEQLLISSDNEFLDISLYLDNNLVSRLDENYPTQETDKNNLHDFWVALEGVSHFLYLVWNANYDRPVSQLELEIQAEVDKFVSATAVNGLENDNVFMREIWSLLFSQPEYIQQMEKENLVRYQKANEYASQYCLNLMAIQNQPDISLHSELRRFYRMKQQAKISHICDLNTSHKI